MKTPARLIAALIVLLGAASASAQDDGAYSIDPTAAQTFDLRQYVLGINRAVCRRLNAVGSPNCTQANACLIANATGGASCTAAQARGANVRIWPDTQAGREEFVTFFWLQPLFVSARNSIPGQHEGEFCVWWNTVANQTQRDADCVKYGLLAGCTMCP